MSLIETIRNSFKNYVSYFPEENNCFEILTRQLEVDENIVDRRNFHGHVTASGMVLSSSNKVLLVFHNTLGRYLQPGGHVEYGDLDLMEAAKREVAEETGLRDIRLHPWCQEHRLPLLMDTHPIPENTKKNEDAHFHHDCMFVFYTMDNDISLDPHEVSAFQWVERERIFLENSTVARALQKMMKMNLR